MKQEINKTSFTINGKTFNSIEDIPEEFKELLKDADGNQVPDIIDEVFTKGNLPTFMAGPMKKMAASFLKTPEIKKALDLASTKNAESGPEHVRQVLLKQTQLPTTGIDKSDIFRGIAIVILLIILAFVVKSYL